MNRPVSNELTLRDLAQAFSRRRAIFFWILCSCLVLGLSVCAFSTRQYEATATIELQSPMGDGLDRQSLMGDAPASSDPLAADITMQTQAKILQSDALALRTIKALNAADRANVTRPNYRWMAFEEKRNATGEGSQVTTQRELAAFHRSLTVKPVGGTRLIEISYLNASPKTAAAVVNELIQQLISFGEETRLQATDQASRDLSKQLEGLRVQSEGLQKRVAAMQVQTGMYDEGTTDATGKEQAYSAILEQFQRASTILSDATQNRILKEAISHVASTGDPELISSLAGNTENGVAASSVTNALGTVQNLRIAESQMQTQLDQLQAKFGPGYPKVAELQAGIQGLQKSIQQETARIAERAENDSAVADRTWSDAQQNYDRLKAQADALNSKTIDYRMTLQEADESRTLYSDLMKRLKEAGILQGLRSNTIGIVDHAEAPRLPSKPAIPLYLAIALCFGLAAGALGVGLMEMLDDTVREFSTVEDMGLRLRGIVPRQIDSDGLGSSPASVARYNDAVRSLRATLMRSRVGANGTIIVMSPVTPEDSARQLALNLSGSASQAGHRVLLVEANLEQQALLGSGFSKTEMNQLGDGAPKQDGKSQRNLPAVYLLAPGDADCDSPPVLESGRMHELIAEWRAKFDLVVINAPAVLFQPDAALLSAEADVTVQVVSYGVTTKTSLRRTSEILREHNIKQMNVVMQGVPSKSIAYRNYYGSTGSSIYTEKLIA